MVNNEKKLYIGVKLEDRDFFVNNEELTKYLILKHKYLIKTQDDLMHAIRLSLEEMLENDKKNKKR